MSRILLVDDSPHAQRMGERILSEEGFEVVTVSNADSALIRLDDVDPDLVIADTVMPGRSGYEICQFLKLSPRHRHVRVVLTAGVLEPLDEEQVKRVQADATLKKPFEASVLVATVRPLAERAAQERANPGSATAAAGARPAGSAKIGAAPFAAVIDAEQIRAAVTVALDAAMEKMVDEITGRVLLALQPRKSAAAPAAATAAPPPEVPAPARTPAALPARSLVRTMMESSPSAARSLGSPPPPMATPALLPPSVSPAAKTLSVAPAASATPGAPPPKLESARRVSALRSRPGSILGLELSYGEPEAPAAAPPSSPLDSLFPNARPAADPDPGPRGSGSRPAGGPAPDSDSRPGRTDKQ